MKESDEIFVPLLVAGVSMSIWADITLVSWQPCVWRLHAIKILFNIQCKLNAQIHMLTFMTRPISILHCADIALLYDIKHHWSTLNSMSQCHLHNHSLYQRLLRKKWIFCLALSSSSDCGIFIDYIHTCISVTGFCAPCVHYNILILHLLVS